MKYGAPTNLKAVYRTGWIPPDKSPLFVQLSPVYVISKISVPICLLEQPEIQTSHSNSAVENADRHYYAVGLLTRRATKYKTEEFKLHLRLAPKQNLALLAACICVFLLVSQLLIAYYKRQYKTFLCK